MSMFTVVGLIGMMGIIINDSIVLVTTVDEYAQDRGLIPAIIDGTADRLRPVMLTTLTTVLGLAPLLYEGSNAGGVPEADSDHAGLRSGLRDGAGAAGGAVTDGDAGGRAASGAIGKAGAARARAGDVRACGFRRACGGWRCLR